MPHFGNKFLHDFIGPIILIEHDVPLKMDVINIFFNTGFVIFETLGLLVKLPSQISYLYLQLAVYDRHAAKYVMNFEFVELELVFDDDILESSFLLVEISCLPPFDRLSPHFASNAHEDLVATTI